jgi:hypothetical protein
LKKKAERYGSVEAARAVSTWTCVKRMTEIACKDELEQPKQSADYFPRSSNAHTAGGLSAILRTAV